MDGTAKSSISDGVKMISTIGPKGMPQARFPPEATRPLKLNFFLFRLTDGLIFCPRGFNVRSMSAPARRCGQK